MDKINRRLNCLRLADILVVTGIFAFVWMLYYNNVITLSYQYKGNIAISLLYLALYFLFVKIYDAFSVATQRKMELAISLALSAFFADAMLYVVICFLFEWFAPVWPLMLALVAQCAFSSMWALVARRWYVRVVPKKCAVLVYSGNADVGHLERELSGDKSIAFVTAVHIDDCIDNDMIPLENADLVFVCVGVGEDRDLITDYCISNSVKFFVVPTAKDILINSARNIRMYRVPLMQMYASEPVGFYFFLKRLTDIVASVLALLLLWPLMLIVAVAIFVYDRHSPFYKQTRLTKDGKTFELIKFRSMRIDAEADGVARLSTGENDDRITPIGKWIRKLRIDELPQLINILKGDMSIVGPRPERPEIAAIYERELPEFKLRLQVKAGLTGYAQVYGKYNSSPKEKLNMDMIYIAHMSPIEDVRIIFTTLRVLFIKESTEGVDAEQVTAVM